jgi:hypothetical protein
MLTIDEEWLLVGEVLFLIETDFNFAVEGICEFFINLLKDRSFAIVSTSLVIILQTNLHLVLLESKSYCLLACIHKTVSKEGNLSLAARRN